MKSVIWADAGQILIMAVVIVMVMIKGTADIGGIAEVLRRNDDGKRFEYHE